MQANEAKDIWGPRICPTCGAQPDESCKSSTGKRASAPHATRWPEGGLRPHRRAPDQQQTSIWTYRDYIEPEDWPVEWQPRVPKAKVVRAEIAEVSTLPPVKPYDPPEPYVYERPDTKRLPTDLALKRLLGEQMRAYRERVA
jgi:hypothetical protein